MTSYKIQNIFCDSVKLFFMGYFFQRNSFNGGLTGKKHIIIFLRKSLKVYRSLKKTHSESVYGIKRKEPFLENSPGEHILARI